MSPYEFDYAANMPYRADASAFESDLESDGDGTPQNPSGSTAQASGRGARGKSPQNDAASLRAYEQRQMADLSDSLARSSVAHALGMLPPTDDSATGATTRPSSDTVVTDSDPIVLAIERLVTDVRAASDSNRKSAERAAFEQDSNVAQADLRARLEQYNRAALQAARDEGIDLDAFRPSAGGRRDSIVLLGSSREDDSAAS